MPQFQKATEIEGPRLRWSVYLCVRSAA